jgi:sarcosine oxidase delta subunit
MCVGVNANNFTIQEETKNFRNLDLLQIFERYYSTYFLYCEFELKLKNEVWQSLHVCKTFLLLLYSQSAFETNQITGFVLFFLSNFTVELTSSLVKHSAPTVSPTPALKT